MTSPQQKISSGFGARTTAENVLNGVDLSGRLAIVTGGYSGLGLETTRALVAAGAQVIAPSRRPAVARETLSDLSEVEVDELDLADLDSVRSFVDRFLDSGRTVDLMINNAGIMACPETRTGPGWEGQFAINHLGHFALVNRLRPGFASTGTRVVAVSSAGHHQSGIRWDDVHFRRGYDKWLAYGQAKTANALFALHLDTLGREAGLRSFSVHPGKILTPLQRHVSDKEMVALGWIDAHGNLVDPDFKTPEQGAATQVWAAASAQLDGMGGVYCEDCDITEIATDELPFVGICKHAADPAEAARLWALSAELTGLDAFAS